MLAGLNFIMTISVLALMILLALQEETGINVTEVYLAAPPF